MAARRVAWGVWLGATAVLYLFENNSWTRVLLLASVLLPLLSVLLTLLVKGRSGLELSAPETGGKGEELTLSLRLPRTAFFAAAGAVLRCRNMLTGEETERVLWQSGRGREESLRVPFRSAHCGLLEWRAIPFRTDLFGLLGRRYGEESSAVSFIAPRLFLPKVRLMEETLISDGERYSTVRPGSDSGETFAIREYRPGDPIRQIHWKLSEKLDKVMLRELGQPISDRVLLLFDLSGADPREDAAKTDALAELFFSVSRALLLAEIGHVLCWSPQGSAETVGLRIEKEEDWLSAQRDFFAGPLGPALMNGGPKERCSHAVLFCLSLPETAELPRLGERTTLICTDRAVPSSAASHVIHLDPAQYERELLQLEL